ncbi:hypothetical protein ACFWTC_05760 [Streptomyces sp. NPDC058619]|uniref:hypothetical protein n=1 Tax=unclassified Streptomyces TaxID=2593676 RepID=UPI00364B085B
MALAVLPAFVLQLLVDVLVFGARDVIAATLMCVFAGSWLAYALVLGTGAAGGPCVLAVLNLALLGFGALMTAVTRPKNGPCGASSSPRCPGGPRGRPPG